jgi:hypothetical protein
MLEGIDWRNPRLTWRPQRSSRLVDQLALMFEELESSATEDELPPDPPWRRTGAGHEPNRPLP